MISTKKLIKMAKKWLKFVVTNKKRISFHRENANGDECATTTTTLSSSLKARKGYFTRIRLHNLSDQIKRGATGDVHKALLSTVAISRCSIASLHQEMRHVHLLVY
ncbi:hypothetical protein LIER_29402 [Lithospermum erythrorhizon]|uniref:Uncharacterized protein n=1 Tax=Lithospermum erythrorhizon TaxID=34254 RepID=A0AAV3RKS9_LITER